MKYYRVIKDLQGGEFGMYRVYTEEQWREQALEWAEMDENDFLIKTLKKLPNEKIIPFISDIWALEFTEVSEEDYNYIMQGEKDYKELKNIVNNWKGTVEELHKLLQGYNMDWELFDCNYKSITATIIFNPHLEVAQNYDIWGKDCMVAEYWE